MLSVESSALLVLLLSEVSPAMPTSSMLPLPQESHAGPHMAGVAGIGAHAPAGEAKRLSSRAAAGAARGRDGLAKRKLRNMRRAY